MRIHVETESDEIIDLYVVPSDKISDIKEQVQEKEGIDRDLQQLFFADENLEDSQTLQDYNIRSESTLKLRLGERMTIFVKTHTGKLVEFDVISTDTIANIKAKFEAEKGVPADQQHLFFDGKQLEDDKTLEEYNI